MCTTLTKRDAASYGINISTRHSTHSLCPFMVALNLSASGALDFDE